MEASTLSSNIIAVHTEPVVALDGEGKERKVIAVINDANIGEPFNLYDSLNAWWAKEDGVKKVEKLMFCLKNEMSIEEACFSIGIARGSYYHFIKIHPEFLDIKQQLSKAFAAIAKLTLGEGLKTDPHLALRYLQGAQPEAYRRSVLPELPQGVGGYARRTEELFTDDKGNILVKRQTAELLESYGDSSDTPEASA